MEENFDQIDKNQLVAYLKELKKEHQKDQKKLQKLEQRYKDLFKINKKLKSSWKIFLEVFGNMLVEECIDLDEDSFFNNQDLKEKFTEFKQVLSKVQQDQNNQNQDQQQEDILDEVANKNIEISNLKQIIFSKDDMIKELKSQIKQQENQNYNSLISELTLIANNNIDNDVQKKIEESDKTNQIIKLKKKIKELQKMNQNGNLSQTAKKIDQMIQTEEIEYDPDNIDSIKSPVITTPKTEQKQSEETDEEKEKTRYIRDLIVNYFKFHKQNKSEQKKIVLNGIFDVLRFSYQQREYILKIALSKKLFFFNNQFNNEKLIFCIIYYSCFIQWNMLFLQRLGTSLQIEPSQFCVDQRIIRKAIIFIRKYV